MHLGRAFERFWLSAETASHRSQESIPISRLVASDVECTRQFVSALVRSALNSSEHLCQGDFKTTC